jgi:hypothetical protein
MRDWTTTAAGLKIEITEQMQKTLEGLDRNMLGLRGLIDWQEEPIQNCAVPQGEDDAE